MKSLAFEHLEELSREPELAAPPAPGPKTGRVDSGVFIRTFNEADRAGWNAFVQAHPEGTFFHLAEWQDVLRRSFGHRTFYLVAESQGGIRGVLPLAQVKSRLFGNSLVSTPFCVYGGALADGDTVQSALEARACELARELQVDYLELRNRRRRHPDWPYAEQNVTFRKQISDAAETNMLAIPRKQRAMVRKGIKEGLRSEVEADDDRYYSVYSESMRNLGSPVFSRKFVRVMREVFGDSCDIVTILKGDLPVASVLNFYFRDEVLPYYGGGTKDARAVAANDFMYWEVMERARQKGCRIFDYGRSKRDTGSYDFKLHWGFEPEQLYYEYYLVRMREMPNKSRTNPKFEKAIELWQKLPIWVTQLVGPPLAKYLL
jgi:FemAB-related protein (PEP-CTERM system-associated)